MDADGLPIIGPGIDYTKVEAIHQKRTMAFLNHFVTHTARFMNRFSCVCEEKLSDLSVRIQRLETSMNILEAKLSSIPGLENVTAPTSTKQPATEPQSSTTVTTSSTTPATTQQPVDSQPQKQEPEKQEEATEQPSQNQAPTRTVAQDPAYAKFLKMLKLGVPAPAIKQKMQFEGLNPDLLDTPDAPAPSSNQAAQEDSDVEFSDEAEAENSDDSSSDFSD